MTSLTEFIKARLDEDAAHAQKDIWAADRATQGKWRALYGVNLGWSQVEVDGAPIATFDGTRHEADVLLVARFKPDTVRKRAERMLREVEAKRRILGAHAEHSDPYITGFCRTCGKTDGPCETKRLLALPYADHPDYRQEWRP